LAKVVFPHPGGPQKIAEDSLFSSIKSLRILSFPKICSCPIKSSKLLEEYCKKNNIPVIGDYHCTIIYSKKPHSGDIKEKTDIDVKAKPKEFVRFDNPDENIYALALKLDSKDLFDLHNYFMKKYDFVYDYDEYIAHVTLSYKAKDIDYKNLEVPNFDITFDKLNIEGLDENWADDKE
jgi:hypothetical protein